MKTLLCLTGTLAALHLVAVETPVHPDTAPPADPPKNILFIFTDDQNHDWIGYRNPWVLTPNIDRLAARGMRFDHGVITLPVCTPSRAAALTGRHNLANGVVGYRTPPNEDEVTFAQHFREAGYLTGLVGKWHIPDRDGANPFLDDFEVIRMQRGNFPYMNPTVIENGAERGHEGFIEDYNVTQTLAIMERAGSEQRPFMIWHNPKTPHGHRDGYFISDEVRKVYDSLDFTDHPVPENFGVDLEGKPPYLLTYRGRRGGQREFDRRNLYMRVTELDRSLGPLVDALEKNGQLDTTYIVFMSDNGVFAGEHGFMSKGLLYEAAIRVPLFFVGPGIPPGRNSRHVVSNVDIAPTLLDLAGLPVPERMHGRSLKGVLTDGEELDREFVFLEVPEAIRNLEVQASLGLRSTRWKFIRTYENGIDAPPTFEELYDLKEDPWELRNLAPEPEHRETIERLRAELDRQREHFSR